jgi:hypothetical protein
MQSLGFNILGFILFVQFGFIRVLDLVDGLFKGAFWEIGATVGIVVGNWIIKKVKQKISNNQLKKTK